MYSDVFNGYDPKTNQYYTVNRQNIMGHWVELGPKKYYIPSSANPFPVQSNYSADFTPNQYTARQLAELQSGSMGGGGNTIPMWMQSAYANKMGRMGAPANGPLPYQLTGSSFRGMPSGKAAPTGGQ